jgi:hypothetical protein
MTKEDDMKIGIAAIIFFMLAGVVFSGGHNRRTDQDNPQELDLPEKGSGIIFFTTENLEKTKDFYISEVGCELWLDQESCFIFRYGNLLLGFCQGSEPDLGGTITFFYPEKNGVDRMYKKFKEKAHSPPRENPKFRIYHFYTQDPEGRAVEFQCFLHPIDWTF